MALASTVAALVPAVALAPLRPYLEASRTSANSAQAAVWLLWSSAALFLGLFFASPRLQPGMARIVERIAGMREARFWALTLVLAALPRLAVGLTLPRHSIADAWWYQATAASLAQGGGFAIAGEPTAYRFPGYPLLLSLTYRLFGSQPALAWFWGSLSTLLMLWAVHRLGSVLHGGTVGRLATLAMAVYPATVLRTAESLSDLPFVAGVLVLAVLLLKPLSYRSLPAVLVGLLLAALTLTRGPGLGLLVVIPAIWALQRVKPRRIVVATLIVMAATAACLIPWLQRNQTAVGRTVLSTNLGLNLYIGNHAGASGGFRADHWPESEEVGGLSPAEVDALLLRHAGSFVVDQPLQFLALWPKKLFHLYALETSAVTAAFHGNDGLPPAVKYAAYGVSQIAYLLVLLLFARRALDLVREDARPRAAQWSSWLMIGYFSLVAVAFFGQDRYRLPILPWMLIEASALVSRIAAPVPRPATGPEP